MRDSVLIQRLQSPYLIDEKTGEKVCPRNCFGAGLPNGGIPQEIMDEISKIFRFDYMGNASFEWGKVWETLDFLIKNSNNCVANSFDVDYKCDEKQLGFILLKRDIKIYEGTKPIFYICPKEYEEDVKKRIQRFAFQDDKYLVEITLLSLYMADPNKNNTDHHKSNYERVGWMELDNHFMFFTDETMFNEVCKFLKIEKENNEKIS